MDVQLVQFGCQSVPKMSDIHFWSKMDVSELKFVMMFHFLTPWIRDHQWCLRALGPHHSDRVWKGVS